MNDEEQENNGRGMEMQDQVVYLNDDIPFDDDRVMGDGYGFSHNNVPAVPCDVANVEANVFPGNVSGQVNNTVTPTAACSGFDEKPLYTRLVDANENLRVVPNSTYRTVVPTLSTERYMTTISTVGHLVSYKCALEDYTKSRSFLSYLAVGDRLKDRW